MPPVERTRYVFTGQPFMNAQFMGLFKALTELKELEPGSRAFAEHLACMSGLLRFQFGFEEDILWDLDPDFAEAHLQEHNQLRCLLAGLLSIPADRCDGHADDHARFLQLLGKHCKVADNQLLAYLGRQQRDTTIKMHIRTRSITRDGG